MNNILFLVENSSKGCYAARALGESIFTEADDLVSLHQQVRDTVRCHFNESEAPEMIRLLICSEEKFALDLSYLDEKMTKEIENGLAE